MKKNSIWILVAIIVALVFYFSGRDVGETEAKEANTPAAEMSPQVQEELKVIDEHNGFETPAVNINNGD